MGPGPRETAGLIEASPLIPQGTDERLNGYGVMGLPFRSGHVLAMRRFTASSIGPAYTSVWHRSPAGEWIFYTTAPPQQSCPRYFGTDTAGSVEAPITLDWLGQSRLRVRIPSVDFEWEVVLESTAATGLMNAVGSALPDRAWQNGAVLKAMSTVAGPLLGVGHVDLRGKVPNGQWFIANPQRMWLVRESTARLGGEDFGPPGAVEPQAHLADFWIPQRGIFAAGRAYFERFDSARHSASTAAPSALSA